MNRHMLCQQALAGEGLATHPAGVGGGAGARLETGKVGKEKRGEGNTGVEKEGYLQTSQVFLWCFNLASTM